ncbi:hypothetical protein I302_107882 [Kwoniella bestiolae CBS 10118]|uniref:Uncharacterized protein n=1 Tax=Kwoniella bestiolae CBS 10118 TaxID=1296100 RepID=A0A1B9FXA5_9TREE|nr:hypothetical protein I302_06376 [Kwoniella bestiolae CBS 10118]OCF23395.1 hypothetical protein I302_06376 [Kwoniella bestiolae CBS 10118]
MDQTQSYDDSSPYITYQGDWDIQKSSDPFLGRYKNSTFHSTTNDGDTAVIVFVGTDIQVFGANRPNHGFLSGLIDGGEKQYMNGTARDPELYQEILFEAHGLENKTHTVVMTNEPFYDTSGGGIWLDIDFFSVNGTPIASSSSSSSAQSSGSQGNSMAYTGTVSLQTVPPSGVEEYHLVAASPTAVQLAVSVAPSLLNNQRPVTDKIANSSAASLQLNTHIGLLVGLVLVYTFWGQLRRSIN